MSNQPLIINNIFQLPLDLPNLEIFEKIISTEKIKIERIISTGQTTPSGEWYDQETDEWVVCPVEMIRSILIFSVETIFSKISRLGRSRGSWKILLMVIG